ncbi:ABC transporter substrate-binding protein [Rhizobium sp. 18055]|uniref:ABC transporter substrate-binding protein n=1 Tax=Rhizobium sp. 18055 TaxID=2681403 RepID=UPI00135BA24A|nr:ABC transporter substrate-binding protein [Rhizobium sp. 18055]
MKNWKTQTSVVAIAAVSQILFSAQSYAGTPRDTLVIATQMDDIVSMDPAEGWEATSSEMIANAYQTLVDTDPADPAKITGVVADSWTVSDDGLTFKFKIRTGLKFASGNPLTADDVVYSIERAVVLNRGPAFILRQFGLDENNIAEKVKKTGDDEVTLVIDKPYAPTFVLQCISSEPVGSIVDSKLLKEHAADNDYGNGWLKTHSAGSGPFVIKDWRANEIALLEKNKEFTGGEVKLNRVIYRHVPEIATQKILIEKGDVDVARSLGSSELSGLADDKDIKIESYPIPRIFSLGMNQKNQYLAKPEVRKALKYLVDYNGLANTLLKGKAVVHQTFLPEGQLGALDENPYTLDVAKAKELLKAAGLENGFDITIDVPNHPEPLGIAESLLKTFGEAGIRAKLNSADSKEVTSKTFARQHELGWMQWGSDYPDPNSNAEAFASNPDNSDNTELKSPAWRQSWEIPELTKMVGEAVLEKDAIKREEIYQTLQRKVLDDGPYLLMFEPLDVSAVRTDVSGFVMSSKFALYGGASKQ